MTIMTVVVTGLLSPEIRKLNLEPKWLRSEWTQSGIVAVIVITSTTVNVVATIMAPKSAVNVGSSAIASEVLIAIASDFLHQRHY